MKKVLKENDIVKTESGDIGIVSPPCTRTIIFKSGEVLSLHRYNENMITEIPGYNIIEVHRICCIYSSHYKRRFTMKITATITIDVPADLVSACKIDPSNLIEYNIRNDARTATLHLLVEELSQSLCYNSYGDIMEMTYIRDYIIKHGDELLFTM